MANQRTLSTLQCQPGNHERVIKGKNWATIVRMLDTSCPNYTPNLINHTKKRHKRFLLPKVVINENNNTLPLIDKLEVNKLSWGSTLIMSKPLRTRSRLAEILQRNKDNRSLSRRFHSIITKVNHKRIEENNLATLKPRRHKLCARLKYDSDIANKILWSNHSNTTLLPKLKGKNKTIIEPKLDLKELIDDTVFQQVYK